MRCISYMCRLLGVLYLSLGLFALAPRALCQSGHLNPPQIFALRNNSTNSYARDLIAISPNGSAKIAHLDGHVLYGMDGRVIAFLQTPARGSGWDSRLLVVNRETGAIVADTVIKDFENGFHPSLMKAPTVERLAVRSQDHTAYFPIFNGKDFDVAEANWQTGKARQLFVPPAAGTGQLKWEITALYSRPPGIAIERGPSLVILDPQSNAILTSLNNAGSDFRPTGRFYAFPNFGIFQSDRKDDTIRLRVEGDFSTPVHSPVIAAYPSSISNLIRFSSPTPHIVDGDPCLIWGETDDTNKWDSISDIVIFDVKANKEILRKTFKPGFSSGFLVDSTARHIYCFNPHTKEFWNLDVKTGEINPFATAAADGVLAVN